MNTTNGSLTVFKTRYNKVRVFILLSLFLLSFIATSLFYSDLKDPRILTENELIEQNEKLHRLLYEQFYFRRKEWKTSNLGSILFKNNAKPTRHMIKKPYVILVWKHWKWLSSRHVQSFGSNRKDPLDNCSEKNCIFTGKDSTLDEADAVVVHLQKGIIPEIKPRKPDQRWIFLNDEAPRNAFSLAKKHIKWQNLANAFNWSMSYRADADIPVPYGRTIPYEQPLVPSLRLMQVVSLIPNWTKKRQDIIATVLMSNCGVKVRNEFIHELKSYIGVDVYGGCSDDERFKKSCPGHFKADCEPVSEYLFYLVLENSNCEQYLTEKIFHHAYSKGSIPVIMGPSLADCEALLPPNSFLHIDQYESIEQLANNMRSLADHPDELLALHLWRNHFRISNEHGYFGSNSFHMCRICEALNYNDREVKIYKEKDLRRFFDPSFICFNSSRHEKVRSSKIALRTGLELPW